ncbi:MAG: T9SS type A sorting domain-containing protein, partial [Candidatus Eisenbacteria bacterium]|nr:T9SS type A sorting domain-containing protein [Candidatus Eisenbacteria bacterium]
GTTWRLRIVGVHPSPFSSAARIVFELPQPSDVDLDIFDISGRRVAALGLRAHQPGRHSITWDAQSGGELLGSGVYYARLRANGRIFERKLILVR